MRVVVTGGSGFVGDRLVARLCAEGHSVRILTRRDTPRIGSCAEVYIGDLTSPDTDLSRFVDDADILFHCAGEINDTARMEAVNVAGTSRLIAASQGRIGKWVQLSSVGAYGRVHNGLVTENSPELPEGLYEETKTRSDRLVQEAAAYGAFSAVVIRPSNIYGPMMRNRSLFQLIRAIERGYFFFVGPPGAAANYIYIDNVIDALLSCGIDQRAKGRTYIVSDHCSLETFIAEIAVALGKRIPRLRIPKHIAQFAVTLGGWLPGFPLTSSRIGALTCRAVYSTEQIERELGYSHRITMEQGLREMVLAVKARSTLF